MYFKKNTPTKKTITGNSPIHSGDAGLPILGATWDPSPSSRDMVSGCWVGVDVTSSGVESGVSEEGDEVGGG